MARLIRNCILSLVLYVILFDCLLDRPLSIGLLRMELQAKAHALAAMPSPKLVILAGSNGPYSHSCAVIGAMLRMPCENAGIAVGIGLDTLFDEYGPLLHDGDVVYMPLELRQYPITRAQLDAGIDSGMLIRHLRGLLVRMPLDRQIGAMFCCDINDLLDSLVEMPMAGLSRFNPNSILSRQYSAVGDRIDPGRDVSDHALMPLLPRPAPTPTQIKTGYGSALVSAFVRKETIRGLLVIGGLPTDFDIADIPDRTILSVAALYWANGGTFIVMPNHSQYPMEDFFDGEDHLLSSCQLFHSLLLAPYLASLLKIPVYPPAASVLHAAASCPGAARRVQAMRVAR
jgi:hypothetical protein